MWARVLAPPLSSFGTLGKLFNFFKILSFLILFMRIIFLLINMRIIFLLINGVNNNYE